MEYFFANFFEMSSAEKERKIEGIQKDVEKSLSLDLDGEFRNDGIVYLFLKEKKPEMVAKLRKFSHGV